MIIESSRGRGCCLIPFFGFFANLVANWRIQRDCARVKELRDIAERGRDGLCGSFMNDDSNIAYGQLEKWANNPKARDTAGKFKRRK